LSLQTQNATNLKVGDPVVITMPATTQVYAGRVIEIGTGCDCEQLQIIVSIHSEFTTPADVFRRVYLVPRLLPEDAEGDVVSFSECKHLAFGKPVSAKPL
jgi:hypothetical protein